MKLGWINATFQPHLYVLSLTIRLVVYCSADENGSEFSAKTLYINSSSLHHLATNKSSSNLFSFSHLNMNKSRDEKKDNFKAESQAIEAWILNYTITTNDPAAPSIPSTRYRSVHNQSTAVRTAIWPIEEGNSSTKPWIPQKLSTHAESLNVTNPELMSAGYGEIKISADQLDPRNDSSNTVESRNWNSSNESTQGHWNDPSFNLSSTTPQAREKVWGFPLSSITNLTASPTLSSLWRSNISASRPSANKFLSGTPHQFSSKSERGEPWNKSDTHGQNHFNSIVNVRVDSSAETLEKIMRLEAMIVRRMEEIEKMAKAMAGDLKSRLNRLEATVLNNVGQHRETDLSEMKQHIESLINMKSKTLEIELKKLKCVHQDASVTRQPHTTNEPITSEIKRLRDSLEVHHPPMEIPEFKISGRKESLAEWRAKRTKLMERWESNFQRGLSSHRKSTAKTSTHNAS